MKGGYQILDLTNIDIVLGSEAVTITDNQVLKELLTLRDYIEDDYDYSKPLNRKLKPILLRLRDEKEDEEIEASLWANLSIIDDNLSFKIEGIINGKTITISAIFEKLQDDDGNDYYAIDEATLLYTDAVANLIEGGTLENAKPLYFHPITIILSNVYYYTMIIINNDETRFTRQTLIDYLKSAEGRFLVNGAYYIAENTYLSPSYVRYIQNDDVLYLFGIDSSGVTHGTTNSINFGTHITSASTFEDDVNKIN